MYTIQFLRAFQEHGNRYRGQSTTSNSNDSGILQLKDFSIS